MSSFSHPLPSHSTSTASSPKIPRSPSQRTDSHLQGLGISVPLAVSITHRPSYQPHPAGASSSSGSGSGSVASDHPPALSLDRRGMGQGTTHLWRMLRSASSSQQHRRVSDENGNGPEDEEAWSSISSLTSNSSTGSSANSSRSTSLSSAASASAADPYPHPSPFPWSGSRAHHRLLALGLLPFARLLRFFHPAVRQHRQARHAALIAVCVLVWLFVVLPASGERTSFSPSGSLLAFRAKHLQSRSPSSASSQPVNHGAPSPAQHPERDVHIHQHHVVNGYLIADPHAPSHPIEHAIALASADWAAKLAAQSTTLEEAVTEYRRRYSRPPPKGFDKWWAYVAENEVQLPDEYNQIASDLAPFWALKKAGLIRRHMAEAAQMRETYTLRVRGGMADATRDDHIVDPAQVKGPDKRISNQLKLIEPIAQWLPDMEMIFSISDSPRIMLTNNQKQDVAACLEEDECSKLAHEARVAGLHWACPFSSPAHSRKPLPPRSNTTLIYDLASSLNICQEPEAFSLHAFASVSEVSPSTRLLPLFSISKTALNADILAVPFEEWMMQKMPSTPWEEKHGKKLSWRGGMTGAHWSDKFDWRKGQRQRLVHHAHGRGADPAHLAQWSEQGLSHTPVERQAAADALFDMHFTGKPIQCDRHVCSAMAAEYGFAPLVTHSAVIDNRYIMDVDGNAWSSRFKRILSSGSTIFKSTIFPEWWSDRVQPWMHFVPIKLDYSELLDTMVFFEGLEGHSDGHHDLARQIAQNGRELSQTAFRYEDMVAYAFRLYLEWGRLYAPEGQEVDFYL